jgi:hypothetical protein
MTHWDLTINTAELVFLYCVAPNSCKGQFMVSAINPNTTQMLEGQIAEARTAQFDCPPGGDVPKEGGSEKHGSKLSTGAVVGIAVGGGAFLGICAALLFFMGRGKELKEIVKRSDERSMMKLVGVGRHADFRVMDS